MAIITKQLLSSYQIALADVLPHPRSRARALVALRQFLRHAYNEEWLTDELSRHVVIPRYTMGDPHPVPTEFVGELLGALPRESLLDFRDRALIHFLIATGCRIAEACGVNRIDLRDEGFRVLGKGGKHRTVFCTEQARHAIAEYLDHRGVDESPALFISLAPGDLHRGRATKTNRLTTNGARHALVALRRRHAGDANRRLYDLLAYLPSPHAARHTTATTLLEATEGDTRLVQEVLGHATLETLRIYTEITDRRKRAAYERLNAFLEQPTSTPPR